MAAQKYSPPIRLAPFLFDAFLYINTTHTLSSSGTLYNINTHFAINTHHAVSIRAL